jgi:hypothetical protein
MPRHLNSASLANEVSQLLQFEPRPIQFDMNGAANAVKVIERAMHVGGPDSSFSLLAASGRHPD